jgi:ABC-type antimicrobial peptide transport system permease subunit
MRSVLTCLGIIIGIAAVIVLMEFGQDNSHALGRGVSLGVTALLHWPTIPSLSAMVAASLGVVFGYYPPWKASRLDPIEALRYE